MYNKTAPFIRYKGFEITISRDSTADLHGHLGKIIHSGPEYIPGARLVSPGIVEKTLSRPDVVYRAIGLVDSEDSKKKVLSFYGEPLTRGYVYCTLGEAMHAFPGVSSRAAEELAQSCFEHEILRHNAHLRGEVWKYTTSTGASEGGFYRVQDCIDTARLVIDEAAELQEALKKVPKGTLDIMETLETYFRDDPVGLAELELAAFEVEELRRKLRLF